MMPNGNPRDGLTNAAPAAPVTIDSAVLGAVTVPETALYTLPLGLVGLERCRRFALVPAGRDGVFWLQSADDPGLAFVLADPFRVAPGFEADIPDAELALLGPGAPGDLLVLTVVTLGGAPDRTATANLRAPVVFNVATRRARQVVLVDDRYSVTEAIAF